MNTEDEYSVKNNFLMEGMSLSDQGSQINNGGALYSYIMGFRFFSSCTQIKLLCSPFLNAHVYVSYV